MSIPMLAGCVIFPAATGVFAQNADEQRKPIVVTPSNADAVAGRDAEVVFMKASSGTRPKTAPESKLTIRGTQRKGDTSGGAEGSGDDFVRIPGHLTFNGGNVVETAESHNIYLASNGCLSPSCFGDPETFLRDLG